MANLKIQNRQNYSKIDTRFLGYFEGSNFYIYPSRYIKDQRTQFSHVGDKVSKFPRNSSNEFHDQITLLNFITGDIDGDEASANFSPVTLTTNQGVIATILIDSEDLLYVSYDTVKSIQSATSDFNSFSISPYYNMPLYSVLLVNTGTGAKIIDLLDLRPDFVLGLDTEKLHFTNQNNEEYEINFLEYLSNSAVSGQNQIQNHLLHKNAKTFHSDAKWIPIVLLKHQTSIARTQFFPEFRGLDKTRPAKQDPTLG
jgi:hypothetical protein